MAREWHRHSGAGWQVESPPPGEIERLFGDNPEVVLAVHAFRQIHMDGRKLPIDPQPSFLGYSVGRWDGRDLATTKTITSTW